MPGTIILLKFLEYTMSYNDSLQEGEAADSEPSCSPKLNRSQFLSRLVKKAAVAGTLTVVPAIAESFIAPRMVAAASGGPPPPAP
jgi:hypothetical protein